MPAAIVLSRPSPLGEAVAEALLRAALSWARDVCGEQVVVVTSEDALAAEAVGVYERFGGPLLVARSDMPRFCRRHADGALADMADGADASFGPTLDGGYYLLALREPRPELLAFAPEDGTSDAILARSLKVAAELDLDVGLLRTERTLRGPDDAAALLADPLTLPEVRAALAG